MKNSAVCARLFLLALVVPFAGGCSDAPATELGTAEGALEGPNGINADLVVDTQWGQGYCVRVLVTNRHPSATTTSWSVALDLASARTFSTQDGVFSGNTGAITVTPKPHNAAIAPAGRTQFGFCASTPTRGPLPVLRSVTSDLPVAPGAVVISEYKLPATLDPEINPAFPIELWASVYRPAALEPGRRYPLIVMLHGNHPTCGQGTLPRFDDNDQYASTGTCPSTHRVVPNHRGFDYLGQDFAARGYLVISINANRGFGGLPGPEGDHELIAGRGRLLLRHLEQLSRWDGGVPTPAGVGVSLADRIDFSEVGLLGHSRGGQGVRFAYQDYHRSGSPWPARIDTPVNFRGIFEIAPKDSLVQGEVVDAPGTPWNVMLATCDWDVRDQEGIRPFDRMLEIREATPNFKSFYQVFGANHNYFNSEWHFADANSGGITGCIDHTPLFNPAEFGSAAQRETARFAASAFFTANVGEDRDETANAVFDPAFPLDLDYRVNRGYHPGGDESEFLELEEFDRPTGTSTQGLPNQTSGSLRVVHSTTAVPPHDPTLKVATIDNVVAGPNTFFQSNFAPAGAGLNLSPYDFLDLRVDRADGTGNEPPVDFLVQLLNDDGSLSTAVSIDDLVDIVPAPRDFNGRTLQTVRIPLSSFQGLDLSAVRALRLTFDTPIAGGILLANIRATRATTPAPAAVAAQ